MISNCFTWFGQICTSLWKKHLKKRQTWLKDAKHMPCSVPQPIQKPSNLVLLKQRGLRVWIDSAPGMWLCCIRHVEVSAKLSHWHLSVESGLSVAEVFPKPSDLSRNNTRKRAMRGSKKKMSTIYSWTPQRECKSGVLSVPLGRMCAGRRILLPFVATRFRFPSLCWEAVRVSQLLVSCASRHWPWSFASGIFCSPFSLLCSSEHRHCRLGACFIRLSPRCCYHTLTESNPRGIELPIRYGSLTGTQQISRQWTTRKTFCENQRGNLFLPTG